MTLPEAKRIIELMDAFRTSKAMFTAVSLGVFDRLERSPAVLADLASELKVQSDPLERLLDACVGLGLLRKKGASYENEPIASAYLCRDKESTLTGYMLYSNDVLYPMWAHLEDAVREGTPRWSQTFAVEGSIFDHFFRTEDAKQTFLKGMHGLGVLSSPRVIAAFDLSGFRKLVDLGGGTGHLAISACERYEGIEAIVFDLPQVIESARAQVKKSRVANRIQFQGGDFFRDDLPQADLFAMSRILHDWPAEKIAKLLAKIHGRLPQGGGLLLAEKLLNDDKSGPISAQMQSLNMLVCTEGKERALGEYRTLLEDAGFEKVQGHITGGPLDAVLAIKKA
jgi:acetylserotonin N-methyltransferase